MRIATHPHVMGEVSDLRPRNTADLCRRRDWLVRWRRQEAAFDGCGDCCPGGAWPADLSGHISMATYIVMIVAVADDSGTGRIESNLEVIRQVPIRRVGAGRIESIFGDVGPMNYVVARLGLAEGRIAFDVCSQRVKDMPIRRIVRGGELIAAIPNHSYRAGNGASRHPGEHSGLSLRSIAHADGWAPGVSLISGKPDKDIRVI